MSEGTKCPHCDHELSVEAVSKLMDSSRLQFSIFPNDGELLDARLVAGTISDLEKLLVASEKEYGAKTRVLVENISMKDKGVTIDLIITRQERFKTKRSADV